MINPTPPPPPSPRKRFRELGLSLGRFKTGRYNAITDVRGVRVGHCTRIGRSHRRGVNKGAIRTGVTAILPNEGNVYMDRVVGGGFVLNGAGEVAGLTQVMEWGMIETPIMLTNTLSVGAVSEAVVRYMVQQHPDIGIDKDVMIPLVGECDDSWMNDIGTRSILPSHVVQAMESARSGPVPEGNVGGGTGMITCDFKGGIGTSSRKIQTGGGDYTIGILVMSNFGERKDLRVDGHPVGRILDDRFKEIAVRRTNYGSIIAVLATDAPLMPNQLNRLSKRVALGIGRAGSYAGHGSGEIVLGFSTANRVPRGGEKRVYKMRVLQDEAMNPLYEASIECTEEAILNALCMGEDMEGINGNFSPALPLDEIVEILSKRF
ncbi:MAG: peptidase S58 [Elusimicrobia bacterium CG1_02_63_36]|nr:MAG: peptidase S58 [Elusimicrobia bacterium CG1_02_63_36]PIP82452.1 MAG: peptidase S58 [Elusimicrobia bacterium CG22_combo_CG10-13_8_21_14_all_63_91]PJA16344.1 MAG: peptidase S58 [Elusimicrobia bacterium CG_4_10_14_0_2_um_filter_63_34]PJB26881.1 MAG: peptidase S58 [Elusimicrobia bacterium CG_4_9_14_3_um_filter_62_55]